MRKEILLNTYVGDQLKDADFVDRSNDLLSINISRSVLRELIENNIQVAFGETQQVLEKATVIADDVIEHLMLDA